MVRKVFPKVLPLFLLAAGFLYYVRWFPRIFDVALYDESDYMQRGVAPGFPDFSNYEWSPLYSLFYRLVSLVVRDPLHLYMAGGLLVLFSAFLFGALGVYLLSRNPVLTILLSALAVFSSAFLILPRVSFFAIAIMGLGLPLALAFRRFVDKAALLTLVAFLLTFVRPEFIAAFYLMLLAAAFSWLRRLWTRRREAARAAGVLFAADSALPAFSFAMVAVLALAWSFPIPAASGRAFMAFGQHYAYRYVADHRLVLNPWQNWTRIMAQEFPGASRIDTAFGLAPGKVLHFYVRNIGELLRTMYGLLSGAVNTSPLFFALALILLLGGIVWRLSGPGPTPPPGRAAWRSEAWGDLLLIAVFAIPPLASTVFVYPRGHYVVMIAFVCCLLLARSLRGLDPPHALAFAAVLGVAFILSVRPLPPVAQPRVEIIRMLRRLPPVRDMLEDDGGWCYYILPPCNAHILNTIADKNEVRALLDRKIVDAVMVSPLMRGYEEANPDAALDLLLGDPHPAGWRVYPLTPGYSILYRSTGANSGG